MAMGYVFGKISDLKVRLPRSGLYLFLKASNAPLGPFYNEHRDRRALLELENAEADGEVCLDRSPHAVFDDGWHEPDDLPPIARWMKTTARVRFSAQKLKTIRLDLTTHLPDLAQRKLEIRFSLNGKPLSACTLFRYGWVELELRLPEELSAENGQPFELEVTADKTWQPRPGDRQNRDDRPISIAVCNLRYS
jgi:hypothetical protein